MSSNTRRAGAYRVRERDMSVHPRSAFASNRPSSVYSSGSHLLQYPKSVITLEFYDSPAANMSNQTPAQHRVHQSPQRRPVRTGRSNSPKPDTRHQVGVKKVGGSVSGGKALSQRTTSQPTIRHYRTGTGFFTITAYLPIDGGKRLKLHCTQGMTVQQVIETEIPDISRTGYQVYQYPSRTLLNPEKDAGVLQDQEIWIEPMRLHKPGEVNDKRLAIVKELLRTEDMYLENLRNIFDVYMEPLRKWSLPQSDMNVMFRSLSRLCDLLMNFFSELEIAVSVWDTRHTLIGGLFQQYPSFWDLYNEYSTNFPKAIRLLKEKCRDEAFNRFLEMKRGAARHTLESLMLLPVQRICEYHRLLMQLLSITSKDHPDHEDLRRTVARVQHMVQSREHQLTRNENEIKLDQVQARFPNECLYLSETLDNMEVMARRNKTNSPASVGSGSSRGHQKKNSMNGLEQLDMTDGPRKTGRTYVQEGPAKFISGLQYQERYLFLFDDILLVAKPTGKQRSPQRTFRLKHRLRLSELWISEDAEPLLIAALRADSCLVIGWPINNNFVVQFSSQEEKSLWSSLLRKFCTGQLRRVQPDSIPITIINHTKSSNQVPEQMLVHCTEKADDVLGRALEKGAIPIAQVNCQLLVKFAKDESAIALHGQEHPFAMQAQHNRHVEGYVGDQKPAQMEFYIKRKTPMAPVDSKGYGVPQRRTKAARLKDWYSRRKSQNQGGREHRGKRKKYRLFGAPLEVVMSNGQLPEIIQDMLIRLYNDGPHTVGIFRKSGNYRKVKELKESINSRQSVDLTSPETSIHVVGALLKELLRSVPNGILLSSRYTEFVATNDIRDADTRVVHIQKILQKLPSENQLFLHYLLPLLHHISEEEETNSMSPLNLAICFAPSLLWPDSGLDVIKNEVPPLIQFMIENSPSIFGDQLPQLYQTHCILSPSPRSYRVPTKKTDGNLHLYRHRRTGSMDTSTSEDSGEEDMPSNLITMKSSGLTVSESQVSVISQQLEDEEYNRNANDLQFTGGHRNHLSPHSARRSKKSRPPERSSSYRGPNDRPPHVQKYFKVDEATRRKSIATQTSHQQDGKPLFVVSQAILPSPNPSASSSSHSQDVSPFIKSHQMQSFDENEEYPLDEEEDMMEVGRRPSQKRKRPYRQSYSVDQLMQSTESSRKASFYDHLSPLSPKEGALPSDGFTTPMEEDDDDTTWMERGLTSAAGTPLHPIHSILSSPIHTTHASNQSIASRSSTSSGGHYYSTNGKPLPQSRPSDLSLVSSISEGSYTSTANKGSPESERTPLNREMVKYEITQRFGIPSRGNSFNGSGYSGHATSRSDSFNQEMDNIQRKFQERRRPSNNATTTLESVSSPPSFDDRPESERHLNSLPRSTGASFVQSPPPQAVPTPRYHHRTSTAERPDPEHDPNKLFVENNSDTESSPSRTLTRREKPNEMNPLRLQSRRNGHSVGRQQATSTADRSSNHPPLNEVSNVPTLNNNDRATETEAKAALTQSLPQHLAVETDTSPAIRPKSAEGTNQESDELNQRNLTEVEKAKLKLGLIPPRRRSRSISDTRLAKGGNKESNSDLKTEVSEVRVETERADKRGMWRAHAPSSSDRKEAYTQRVKGGPTHTDNPPRTAKTSAPNAPAFQRTQTAPEMGSKRRAATMPEYLVARTAAVVGGRAGRVLGRGLVRTVKITSYTVPEPRKIHRINLRTFH